MLTNQQLLRCVAPDETAAQFFARQATEAIATGLACVDQHVKLRPGQVLELVGPTGVGKSELLAEVGGVGGRWQGRG
jgi:ABC-type phosphonate transport system ATPase subunit